MIPIHPVSAKAADVAELDLDALLVEDPAAIAGRGVDKPFASIDFDFRLHREVAEAPPAQVERQRAAA